LFEPLQWQQTAGLLAYFIENAFEDTDKQNLWEITKHCFTIKGKQPNKNTLKNTVSKYNDKDGSGYNNKPKRYEKIDAILSL
jgi:hypothetical protein